MKVAEVFGRILRDLRKQRDITQEQLAEDTGLDRTFISLLERGERQPSLSTLIILASALRLRASDLVKAVESALNEAQQD